MPDHQLQHALQLGLGIDGDDSLDMMASAVVAIPSVKCGRI